MSWTDERIETLRNLWEQGLTASQIAENLGSVSRNAVIGKAHRLGLKARPSPVKANETTASPVAKPVARAKPEPAPRATAPVAPRPPRPAPPVSTAPTDDNHAATPHAAPTSVAPAATVTPAVTARAASNEPRMVSIGPGGFIRQGPGDQQAPIPPAPPRRRVPAKPSDDINGKTTLLDLNERICRWPMGHPGEADFHFCGVAVNPGYPYCVDHCGRAFQAQLPRGTRRPPPPPPFGGSRVR
jgi:GcrA cell cycle regulator